MENTTTPANIWDGKKVKAILTELEARPLKERAKTNKEIIQ